MSTATQAYHGNMNIANIAKEKERFRNLRLAQAKQQKKQEQQEQQAIQPVNRELSKRQNIQQKSGDLEENGQVNMGSKAQTDAQRKAKLRNNQKSYKTKRTQLKKKGLSMRKYNRWIKRYDRAPWVLMYAAAAGSVIGGLFTELLIGYLFVIPCTLFIDVMIWKTLNKKDRMRVRGFIIAATGIKLIPFISIVPTHLFLVYKTKVIAKKRKREAIIKIRKNNML